MSFENFIARDLALDSEGDLLIENGDILFVESDDSHVRSILFSAKGNWRFQAIVGVDLDSFVNAVGYLAQEGLRQRIQNQLDYDGFRVDQIQFQSNKIQIRAKRIN